MLSPAQIQQFKIDGYLVLPGFVSADKLKALTKKTRKHLARRVEPYELEADVHYPGAPDSREADGGETIRRLLQAYARDPLYAHYAKHPKIKSSISQLLQCDHMFMNPNHHNCVMTKQAAFSSQTLWHRDTRYWQFSDKYLINAWFALGDELRANGALSVLPGSHRWEIQTDALDEYQFLVPDHPYNKDRLATQRLVELNAGDLLLFSAHLFHAAGENKTDRAKLSMVFTYHAEPTRPQQNSRSSLLEPVAL